MLFRSYSLKINGSDMTSWLSGPSIINPKRKRRIAAGSGTRVEDVNKLLKQFEMMQKMMKQFKKSPKGFARRLGGMMGNPNAFRGLK